MRLSAEKMAIEPAPPPKPRGQPPGPIRRFLGVSLARVFQRGANETAVEPWGPGTRIGQLTIFVAGLLLLVAHTFADKFKAWGWTVGVDEWSILLFAVLILAVLMPYLQNFKITKEGVEASMVDRAGRASRDAAEAVGASGGTPPPPADPGPLSTVAESPLASVEASRRLLAASLQELAKASGIAPQPTLEGLANELAAGGKIDEHARSAVVELARLIQEAKAKNGAGPGLALEIDYAAQMLVGLFKQKAKAATNVA